MVITARFNSQCKRCHQPIRVGDLIVWVKGVPGATHASACEAAAPAPSRTVDGSGIAAFLLAAKARVEALRQGTALAGKPYYPNARFLAPGGGELRLNVAGDRSREPGAVNVLVDGRWIGRVSVNGETRGALAANADLLAALDRIATDPARYAKEYGALACRCSFCGLGLTDDGSVEVGYGPVCARNYGLPHHAAGTPNLTALPMEDTDDHDAAHA